MAGASLSSSARALGLDGVGHGRLRQVRQLELYVCTLGAQGIAGESVAQLAYCADVACVQLCDFDCLAALHDAQVRELFLAAAGVIFQRGIVLDDTRRSL